MSSESEQPGTTAGGLRSAAWFGPGLAPILHRAAIRSIGMSYSPGRPMVGVCSPWSEFVNCNYHFRALAEAVKRGITRAGGLAFEFSTMSLGENLMKPTAMLYRNLMAMEVEETIRSYPMDAVVLLVGCDKTVPAQLMGAASANVPAIAVTGGPSARGCFQGKDVSTATDLWGYADEYRAGRLSEAEMAELEGQLIPSVGHCNEMGTASTMAAITEALGMSLPGTAGILATHAGRYAAAEASGERAVELARHGLQPADILTEHAFENAAAVLMALGGSTNAVIHLIALAGRLGVPFSLTDLDRVARRVPVIANVKPTGRYLFEDLQRAGGIPAVMRELGGLVHADQMTVTGRSWGAESAGSPAPDGDVLRSLDAPIAAGGAMRVVRGTLAPAGAVIKISAASPDLLSHRGPAVVFDGIRDLVDRIDDPSLDVAPESVLVLRQAGPVGAPGMPEWGHLPIPRKLLKQGVRDMVRVSDARMSGTSYGTVVLHVAPESAVGGPLAVLRDGDDVVLDAEAGQLDIAISPEDLSRRRQEHQRDFEITATRGYVGLYRRSVLQADRGCDFDFLARGDDPLDAGPPLGLNNSWAGGW